MRNHKPPNLAPPERARNPGSCQRLVRPVFTSSFFLPLYLSFPSSLWGNRFIFLFFIYSFLRSVCQCSTSEALSAMPSLCATLLSRPSQHCKARIPYQHDKKLLTSNINSVLVVLFQVLGKKLRGRLVYFHGRTADVSGDEHCNYVSIAKTMWKCGEQVDTDGRRPAWKAATAFARQSIPVFDTKNTRSSRIIWKRSGGIFYVSEQADSTRSLGLKQDGCTALMVSQAKYSDCGEKRIMLPLSRIVPDTATEALFPALLKQSTGLIV